MDDQEMFERMEVDRVMDQDPSSLAFFLAQKTRRANITQNMASLKMMRKNKRGSA